MDRHRVGRHGFARTRPARPKRGDNSSKVASGDIVFVDCWRTLPGFTIRHTVPEVRIQFTVSDERGRLHTDLNDRDFRVIDNRSAVLGIREFSRLDDLPLQIGILLDVSDSVKNTVRQEREVAESFLEQAFREQSDIVAVSAFSNSIRAVAAPDQRPKLPAKGPAAGRTARTYHLPV